MKFISFFNEKGGVGKTTHTLLMASYLAYCRGMRVLVVDLESESRTQLIRDGDLALLSDPASFLSRWMEANGRPESFFDIESPLVGVASWQDSSGELIEHLWDIAESGKYDVVLIDFPAGGLENGLSFYVLSEGLLDFVLIPVDTDKMTRRCALRTADACQSVNVPARLFWNNLSVTELSNGRLIEQGESVFREFGFEFMDTRIKSFVKARRDADGRIFVRNSVCWPSRYVELNCPELVPLYDSFLAVADRGDGSGDGPDGTQETVAV